MTRQHPLDCHIRRVARAELDALNGVGRPSGGASLVAAARLAGLGMAFGGQGGRGYTGNEQMSNTSPEQ